VATTAAIRPENFAYPTAASAAASSWRTCTNRIESACVRRDSKKPLIWSPQMPKQVSTCHSSSRSTIRSEIVLAMVDSRWRYTMVVRPRGVAGGRRAKQLEGLPPRCQLNTVVPCVTVV
jgi:hypothetical protein